jgi:4-diphosphocytidyl-2-C-methyl-D-erythritol kinase
MESIKFAVNAKINLSLAVIGKRPDGYHNLDTVMHTVDISDSIFIKKSPTFLFESDKFGGENNIAFKAAHCFFGAAGIEPSAEIRIKKAIPASAGLGGGSADAAGVLVGLDRLFGTGFSKSRLREMAVSLGADVPFLIDGGTQRARGIGEILTTLPHMPDCTFLIVLAGEKPSTGEMFARLDRLNYPKPDIEKTVSAINRGSYTELINSLGNSFSVLWDGREITEKLYNYGADAVALSGSGPARFAVFSDEEKARATLKALEAENVKAYLCHTAESSVKDL